MTRSLTIALGLVCAGVLSACEEPAAQDVPALPPRGQGMPPEQAQVIVGDIFAAHECKMTVSAYLDALDEAGYTLADADITTPGGHAQMVDRMILESTPMVLVSDELFTRQGSTLTSKIGGCADVTSFAS